MLGSGSKSRRVCKRVCRGSRWLGQDTCRFGVVGRSSSELVDCDGQPLLHDVMEEDRSEKRPRTAERRIGAAGTPTF